ncbi:hypothetical protein [Paraburkholderia sp. A1RO-5L]|uniref:hypothetical protein n=1 Tax=unclassified Paraburkholderia TaxID=2615204 RepID=UPI003B98732D
MFLPTVAAGAVYVGMHLADDLSTVREHSALPWFLLVIALFIALGFEFVNGLNDTGGSSIGCSAKPSETLNFRVAGTPRGQRGMPGQHRQ